MHSKNKTLVCSRTKMRCSICPTLLEFPHHTSISIHRENLDRLGLVNVDLTRTCHINMGGVRSAQISFVGVDLPLVEVFAYKMRIWHFEDLLIILTSKQI